MSFIWTTSPLPLRVVGLYRRPWGKTTKLLLCHGVMVVVRVAIRVVVRVVVRAGG